MRMIKDIFSFNDPFSGITVTRIAYGGLERDPEMEFFGKTMGNIASRTNNQQLSNSLGGYEAPQRGRLAHVDLHSAKSFFPAKESGLDLSERLYLSKDTLQATVYTSADVYRSFESHQKLNLQKNIIEAVEQHARETGHTSISIDDIRESTKFQTLIEAGYTPESLRRDTVRMHKKISTSD